MDIEVNQQNFIKLLKDNHITSVFSNNGVGEKIQSSLTPIILSTYFRIFSNLNPDNIKQYGFSKIAHIKLLRECSKKINYKNEESETFFGLKFSKELVEKFEEIGLFKRTLKPRDYYELTDIGKLFQLEECVITPNVDIVWIKTCLLSNCVDIYQSTEIYDGSHYTYLSVNERFIQIYLDFICYGRVHVADL